MQSQTSSCNMQNVQKTNCFHSLGFPMLSKIIASTLLLAIFVSFCRYQRAVSRVSNFPGLRLLVSPMSTLGLMLPSLPAPLLTYPGFSFPWELKHKGLFALFKCDTVSLCAWDGRTLLYTSDASFIHRLVSATHSAIFPKPTGEYSVLSYFGDNLVISEKENWARQQSVTGPAFTNRMYQQLWLDMKAIVHDMIETEDWDGRSTLEPTQGYFTDDGEYLPGTGEIYFSHVVDLTLRMALAAIARTGFGIDFQWHSDESFTKTCASFGDSFWWTTVKFFYSLTRPIFIFCTSDQTRTNLHTLFTTDNIQSSESTQVQYNSNLSPFSFSLKNCIGRVFLSLESQPENVPKMRIQEALHLVAKESTLKLAISSLPSFFQNLPFRRLRRMNMAFDCLREELGQLIAQRRAELEDGETDLLSNLVRSASLMKKRGFQTLTDDEIMGNAYIYLLAGHETTAHSLANTLFELALNPEMQDKAYQEIMEIDPFENTLFCDYDKFPFIQGCYLETLRLYPPVQQIPKVANEDTVILVQKSNEGMEGRSTSPTQLKHESGDEAYALPDPTNSVNIPVKKGTIIMISPPGLHYNPQYWSEPERFNPERFLGPYNKSAFIPFGVGSRACLGRKFSETESVSMLVHLLRNYSVHVPMRDNETIEDIRKKYSKASVRITLTPERIPLIFKKRPYPNPSV